MSHMEKNNPDNHIPETTELGEVFKEHLNIRSISISGLFLLAVFYTLYLARAVFIPIFFAIILKLLLAPAVDALKRLRIPQALGSAVVIIALLAVISVSFYIFYQPAADWIERTPQSLRKVEQKLRFIKGPVEKVSEATKSMEKITDVGPKSEDEEARLLESSPPALKAILLCALHTGMRKNEILSLKWDNVDIDKNLIILEHTNTKSKKTRRIPIKSTLRKILLEQKLKFGSSNYVFLSTKGSPYKRHDSLKQSFAGACKRANISGLRFHDLRHTAATRMIESGASIVAVSRILGHADLKTTMRYAHPEDTLKDAVETLTAYNPESFTDKSTDLANMES